jgi:hypothetical protein
MSDLKMAEEALATTTFVGKLTDFEGKHRPFINLIIRPLLMLVIFLSVGYYTMWMSTNYIKQEKFEEFVKNQNVTDKTQDDVATQRFEVIQAKLELIINNQTAFTEQLKAYNQLMANYQKQLDTQNDRIMWLERQHEPKQ